VAGAAIALSLVHGGPAPCCFTPAMFQLLAGNEHPTVTLDLIMNGSVRAALQKVKHLQY